MKHFITGIIKLQVILQIPSFCGFWFFSPFLDTIVMLLEETRR